MPAFFVQFIVLAMLALCSLFIGVADLSPSGIFRMNSEQIDILSISRIPRLCSVIVAGASLSVAGLIMQRIKPRHNFSSAGGNNDGRGCKRMFHILCL